MYIPEMLFHTWQGGTRGLSYLDSKVSFQAGFRPSVRSVITRFESRDLMIKIVLNCECLVIETKLRGPTHTIYYKIKVLISKVMAL